MTSQTLLPVVVLTADQSYATACEKSSQWIKSQLAHSHTTSHNMWDMNCLSTSQLCNSVIFVNFIVFPMYSSFTYLMHNIHTYRPWLWRWVIRCDDTEHYHVHCTTIAAIASQRHALSVIGPRHKHTYQPVCTPSPSERGYVVLIEMGLNLSCTQHNYFGNMNQKISRQAFENNYS